MGDRRQTVQESRRRCTAARSASRKRESIDDNESTPIEYGNLSSGEQDLLDRVIERGGYETCQPSKSFNQFVDRVWDRTDEENPPIYLERDGTYYRLYVKVTDVIVTY